MHLFLLSPFSTMAYSFPSNRLQDSDLGKHYNYPKYTIKCIILTSINITFFFFWYKISAFLKINVIIKTLKYRKRFLIFLTLLKLSKINKTYSNIILDRYIVLKNRNMLRILYYYYYHSTFSFCHGMFLLL